MATAGLVFLVVAFVAAAVSIVGLLAGQLMLRGAEKGSSRRQIVQRKAAIISRFGRLGVVLTFVALLVCCAIIVICFFTGDEPLYRDPQAHWSKEASYGVVHRIASTGTVKGAGAACLRWAVEQARYLRIDTHKDNKAMQHVLRKLGFHECGAVKAHDGTPRLAFDASAEDLT